MARLRMLPVALQALAALTLARDLLHGRTARQESPLQSLSLSEYIPICWLQRNVRVSGLACRY